MDDDECLGSPVVRYRPDNLDDITAATKFSKDEIRWVYRAFKQECPSGAINELTFKNIYAKFFPLGGQYCDSKKLYCNTIQMVTHTRFTPPKWVVWWQIQCHISLYGRPPLIWIHLDSEPSKHAENPENCMSLKIGYTGNLKLGCYNLQYVPASKPFDHAWFEVLEAIKLIFLYMVDLHLFGFIWILSHPNMQIIQKIGCLWKQATLAIWSLAVTIYSMYLRLNLSTTPDLKFEKP